MRADALPVMTCMDSERSVLSMLLVFPHFYRRTSEILEADDFWGLSHRDVWEAIGGVISAGSELNMHTLCAELKRKKRLDRIGGVQFLARLLDDLPIMSHMGAHVWAVKEASVRRQLYYAARKIVDACEESGGIDSLEELAGSEIEKALDGVRFVTRSKGG